MKIAYQNKIVAFIDVLGFSNLVYSDTTHLISKYFDFVLEDLKPALKKNGFNYLLISDSIVISAKNDRSNLKTIIEILCILQAKLLLEGILIRGAISFGGLYLNKSRNILVGPGMINSYKLESKAIYPRIILDKKFISQYFDGTTSALREMRNNIFELLLFSPPSPYSPDYLYLNYLRFFAFTNKVHPFQKIILLLKDNYYKNDYIEKYEWLRAHTLLAVSEQLDDLEKRETSTKNSRKSIRHLKKFIEEFGKL